jgi:uncharacterized protein YdhG (YjbR/CyaY superfamily)
MKAKPKIPETIDEYIATSREEVRPLLQKIRQTVHNAAPQATEAIKYGMPTFVQDGNLVYFAAYKNHIGFYPVTEGMSNFKELAKYDRGKGTAQFPLDEPIPYGLITKMVKVRVKENKARKSPKK